MFIYLLIFYLLTFLFTFCYFIYFIKIKEIDHIVICHLFIYFIGVVLFACFFPLFCLCFVVCFLFVVFGVCLEVFSGFLGSLFY